MSAPWDDLRLEQVEQSARACPDACAADVVSLVAEVRRFQRLLDRAYPLLHNPYTQQTDPLLATQYDQIIRDVEHAIAHLKDEPEPERAELPCGSCDGSGCPNCRDQDPRAALAYEVP